MNAKDFDVNEDGVIQDPGKFEGETLATVFFWEASLNGDADNTVIDGDTYFDYFKMGPQDVADLEEWAGRDFPDLREKMMDNWYFRVFADSVGFVHGSTVTKDAMDTHEADVQEVEDGEEED